MRVVFWSDFNCPYSYIGLNRLSQAIDELNLECEWEMMAFELPLQHSFTASQISEIEEIAKSEGLTIHLSELTSSRDAHRLVKFTKENCPESLLELIFRIYEANFSDKDISSHEVLIGISKELGMDESIIEDFLSARTYKVEVEVDTEEAVFNGITSVPHYTIHTADHQLIIPGAFEKEDFKIALKDLTSGEIRKKSFL
jgi:predicted DsbA family dithiol-disulfide isomerase